MTMTDKSNPRREALSGHLRDIVASGRPARILFVCLGNICRSPAGEAVMLATADRLEISALWEVDSAGTGNYHIGDLADPRMRSHAAKRGIRLLHRARQVSATDLEYFDIVIAMDGSNLRDLRAISPTVETDKKIIPMASFLPGGELAPATPLHEGAARLLDPVAGYDHIPDPYYSGAEGFELVLDLLEAGCLNIATLLSARPIPGNPHIHNTL